MRAAVFVTCNLLTMNPGWVFWLASKPTTHPVPMGKDRLITLSGAIQGGEVIRDAGLWWQSGNFFPYKHNEGQVYASRCATRSLPSSRTGLH